MLDTKRHTVKSKKEFSKQVVALVVFLNVAFAAAVLTVFWHTGSEPSALVAAWFTFTTGELWMLSSIKKSKIKDRDKNGQDQLEAEID